MALRAVSPLEPIPSIPLPRVVPLEHHDRAQLMTLRHLLRGARAAGRVDGFSICAAVGCGISQQRETLATTLMQVLRDVWGQAPVIFHPTAQSASFDEAWMLSLIKAQKADDTQSKAFLLASRLPRHTHRMVLSLLAQLIF